MMPTDNPLNQCPVAHVYPSSPKDEGYQLMQKQPDQDPDVVEAQTFLLNRHH